MKSTLKVGSIALFFVSAAAIACTIHHGPKFDLNVGTIDRSDAAEKVGNALQAAYGSIYGKGSYVEGSVRYQVRFLGAMGTNSIPFIKPCDKTFIEAAEDIWNNSLVGGGGGASCGGGMAPGPSLTYGIVGYTPVYRTGTTCSGSNCSSTGSVLVGYQPQWGVVADGPPMEHDTYC